MMAGHHRTTVRLSALTERFLASFLKSLYLSSHSREMACKSNKRASEMEPGVPSYVLVGVTTEHLCLCVCTKHIVCYV